MTIQIAAKTIENTDLLTYSRAALKEYGSTVVENRAIPDFRDGLKPVYRRILWTSFHNIGCHPDKPPVKSARVVGGTLGSYHPHGEMAIYNALVTMVNQSIAPMDGKSISNFGSLTDGAAAARYTETRLSKYAALCLLNREYLNVTPMVDNYDGKEKEPLFLPALVPNLLLNGIEGIAVGVRTAIPPVHPETVLKNISLLLKGEDKWLIKSLKFNFPYPCATLTPFDGIKSWYKTGSGSLRFGPYYEWIEKTNTLVITGFPPTFNWENVVKKLAENSSISSFHDMTSKKTKTFTVEIRLKSTVDNIEKTIETILKFFEGSFTTNCAWTVRNSETDVQFKESNIPNFLKAWVDYRIDLEKRYQTYLITTYQSELKRQKLMLFATEHLKEIFEALKSREPDTHLARSLKLNEQDTKIILDLPVRQLSKLSADKINSKIADLNKSVAISTKIEKNPNPTITTQLETNIASVLGL